MQRATYSWAHCEDSVSGIPAEIDRRRLDLVAQTRREGGSECGDHAIKRLPERKRPRLEIAGALTDRRRQKGWDARARSRTYPCELTAG